MKKYNAVVAGCGSVGLPLVKKLVETRDDNVLGLEASSRLGGSPFLVSRLHPRDEPFSDAFEIERELPPLKVWWEREWRAADAVDWLAKDWAFVLPQWNFFFRPLVELRPRQDFAENLKPHVLLEKPISEVSYDGATWTIRSGGDLYATSKLYWTLGLKSFQGCFGKKQAEDFLVKNSNFIEAAREAENVFAAEYRLPEESAGLEPQFLGIPVRHESKLYLSFVSLWQNRVESFAYLPNDLLTQPKEISFFEKSLKRSVKHVLASLVPELERPNLGVINEARGHSLALPWALKDDAEKGIFFERDDQILALTGN